LPLLGIRSSATELSDDDSASDVSVEPTAVTIKAEKPAKATPPAKQEAVDSEHEEGEDEEVEDDESVSAPSMGWNKLTRYT
jgi:hypothetical protein